MICECKTSEAPVAREERNVAVVAQVFERCKNATFRWDKACGRLSLTVNGVQFFGDRGRSGEAAPLTGSTHTKGQDPRLRGASAVHISSNETPSDLGVPGFQCFGRTTAPSGGTG